MYLCINKVIKTMETKKKYELNSETIEIDGTILHQIKALKDFSDVKAGDLGGWIEKEQNLSQIGDAWIGGNAKVYGNAVVCDNAKVFDDAAVCGNAMVYDNAEICGNAVVFSNSKVCDTAKVYGHAIVEGNAEICGNAVVRGNVLICGNAKVFGNAFVYGDAIVWDNVRVEGDAVVYGKAKICGDAVVKNNEDYIVFKNFWGSGRHFTWTRSNNMWKAGCFYGTGEELIEKAYADSETSGRECEKIVRLTESTLADK